MSRLVIRNVGPIKSVDINLNKVNVFIGPQGSGKSTIAKIVSFCSWMEKMNDATYRVVADGLVERLGSFHHMKEYFSEKSVLLYVGDNIAFVYNWKGSVPLNKKFVDGNSEHFHDKEYVFYSNNKLVNPKVSYIRMTTTYRVL